MQKRPLGVALMAGILALSFVTALGAVPTAHAAVTNGLVAYYWDNSFFGAPIAAWPGCTAETTPPAGAPFTVAPTAATVDPNIAHGASTGFHWDESPPGSGFSVPNYGAAGSTLFVNTDYSVEWTGYIFLQVDTTYHFTLYSDDGAWLYINTTPGSSTISGANLVLNDAGSNAIQPPTSRTSGAVTVTSTGNYPIEVDYFETCDSQSGVDLSWSTSAGGGTTIIPTGAFTPVALGSNMPKFSPPPTVPEFPMGMAVLLGLMVPLLLVLRKRASLFKVRPV